MAVALPHTIFYQLLVLITVLVQTVEGLPGGCGGELEIIDVVSPAYNDTIWACSGIDRSSLLGGAKVALAASNRDNVTDCANYCATTLYPDGLMAGILDPKNAYQQRTPVRRFSIFFEAWNPGGRPSKAQKWGVFTCPAGAQSGPTGGAASYCGPLTIEPAQPALADLGIIGGCSGFCSKYPRFQWVLSQSPSDCVCYSDLAGLKVTLNYSSTNYVLDYYDFQPHPTTSSTSVATGTSTSTSSRSTTSTAAAKFTLKSNSQSTSTATVKSSSKLGSTTKKTSLSKRSLKATSLKSILHINISTSHLSFTMTSSKASSSESTLHTSTSSLRIPSTWISSTKTSSRAISSLYMSTSTLKTTSFKSTTHSTTKLA